MGLKPTKASFDDEHIPLIGGPRHGEVASYNTRIIVVSVIDEEDRVYSPNNQVPVNSEIKWIYYHNCGLVIDGEYRRLYVFENLNDLEALYHYGRYIGSLEKIDKATKKDTTRSS